MLIARVPTLYRQQLSFALALERSMRSCGKLTNLILLPLPRLSARPLASSLTMPTSSYLRKGIPVQEWKFPFDRLRGKERRRVLCCRSSEPSKCLLRPESALSFLPRGMIACGHHGILPRNEKDKLGCPHSHSTSKETEPREATLFVCGPVE